MGKAVVSGCGRGCARVASNDQRERAVAAMKRSMVGLMGAGYLKGRM